MAEIRCLKIKTVDFNVFKILNTNMHLWGFIYEITL
jgi:hypothetical protein